MADFREGLTIITAMKISSAVRLFSLKYIVIYIAVRITMKWLIFARV